MAKNWMLAEAYKEIVAGNKDAIADIGGRFPIATTALGMIGENAGVSMVFGALDFVTVRKVEANLKEGVKPIEDDPKPEKEAKKAEAGDKPKGKRGRKPKQKVEEVPEEKEVMNKPEEADEPDYESMTEVELFKVCKAKGLKPAPKQEKQYYLDLLNPKAEEAEEDSDDWDDEEDPVKEAEKEEEDSADEDDDDWDI